MPDLGCNYSPQLVNLLQESRVELDWIKLGRRDTFSEEFSEARPFKPLVLHVLPHAGAFPDDRTPWTWNDLNETIQRCGSPHIALHLSVTSADLEDGATDHEAVERMIAVTTAWVEHLSVPLLVENVPFYGFRGTLRCATDPGVVREVCESTGAGLLLDLAHARVAAWHREDDARAYLKAMPLERVCEIHVSGPIMDPEEGLRDRHLEMQEDDYALLTWALGRTEPEMVVLEYGGTGPRFEWRSDAALLERQLARLRDICPKLPQRNASN